MHCRVRRLFRRSKRALHLDANEGQVDRTPSTTQETNGDRPEVTAPPSPPSDDMFSYKNHYDSDLDLEGFVDDLDETSTSRMAAPEWMDGPRDETSMPAIIQSTFSSSTEEAEYAMKQMLGVLETLDPAQHMELFVGAFDTISSRLPPIRRSPSNGVDWSRQLMEVNSSTLRLTSNMSQVIFDVLPSLFETANAHPELHGFRDALSLFLVIPLCTTHCFPYARRQAIQAVSALLERDLLDQDLLCQCVVPGLFDVYEASASGQGFSVNDQRCEVVTALTQVIVWSAITDRDWLYANFVPRFSHLLTDASIHARKSAIQIFGNLAQLFGEEFAEKFLVPHIVALCDDPNWAVRKAVCEVFVGVAERTSRDTRAACLVSHFVRLLNDPSKWVSFVAFQQLGPLIATFANSAITGLEIRNGKIYSCGGRSSTSFSEGPTITTATLEPPLPTTPTRRKSTPATPVDDLPPAVLKRKYANLPEGCYVPTELDEPPQEVAPVSPIKKQQLQQARRGERVMDSVLSGLHKMLNTLEIASPKRDGGKSPLSIFSPTGSRAANSGSALTTSSIAAKCSSSDDLSRIGLDDSIAVDSDDEDETEKTFVQWSRQDDDDDYEDEDGNARASADDVTQSSEEETLVPLSYWSTECDLDLDEEELRPFGASTTSPSTRTFLENRLDVTTSAGAAAAAATRPRSASFNGSSPKMTSPVGGSPLQTSPRRHTMSAGSPLRKMSPRSSTPPPPSSSMTPTSPRCTSRTSSLSPASARCAYPSSPNTTFDELFGASMDDDANKILAVNADVDDVRQNRLEEMFDEDVDMDESDLEPVFPKQTVEHVPQDLVESFMKIIAPGDQYELDIFRHCAHNFPAVAYTLGRAAWPRLKDVYERLAYDEQKRVRSSIAHSIHEIAFIVGPEITDRDLLPVFVNMRNDETIEVRVGILKHLFEFVKCLSLAKRSEFITTLPQFFPIGTHQVHHADWRSRFELISQLTQLCSLYSVKDINEHMSGIALTLANDRVAEVRREAVVLVARIVGELVKPEWEQLKVRNLGDRSTQTLPALLSDSFIRDIIVSFFRTEKWTRRQTFGFICAQVVKDRQCTIEQFAKLFLRQLEALVRDKVPNVRMAACEAMAYWKDYVASDDENDLKCAAYADVYALAKDDDIDVSYLAKRYEGLVSDADPINTSLRTRRMHQRVEDYFGYRYVFRYSNGSGSGTAVRVRDGRFIEEEGTTSSTTTTTSPPMADTSDVMDEEAPPVSPRSMALAIQKTSLFAVPTSHWATVTTAPTSQAVVEDSDAPVATTTALEATYSDDANVVDMEIDEPAGVSDGVSTTSEDSGVVEEEHNRGGEGADCSEA